jgi:hypothetical protein
MSPSLLVTFFEVALAYLQTPSRWELTKIAMGVLRPRNLSPKCCPRSPRRIVWM